MYILHIDSTTKICSVAISKNDKLLELIEVNSDQLVHSEKLHLFIEECLLKANLKLSDLKAINVSKGPGSSTGLRIGVSAAKGLAYGLNIPLKNIKDSLITIRDIDSLVVPFTTSINDNLDEIDIKFEVSPSDNYRIFILPESIRDIRGVVNDTLEYSVVSQSIEDYGNVYLDIIRNNESKFILHMINSNGDIIREFNNVSENSTYNFEYIRPGKYTFRLIEDSNNNNIWDTGNYLRKVQPEPVYYFSNEIEVRANWDLNEIFDLNQTQIIKDSIN